jgi:hypothetical protein
MRETIVNREFLCWRRDLSYARETLKLRAVQDSIPVTTSLAPNFVGIGRGVDPVTSLVSVNHVRV